MRKYVEYKAVEKEGLAEGRVEFAIPNKPGEYVARYLKSDYTELALSAPVPVRSALTVLLSEVKALTVSGDTESVVELLETVMLRIKGNDDTLHRQALESWRQQQARKAKPTQEDKEKDNGNNTPSSARDTENTEENSKHARSSPLCAASAIAEGAKSTSYAQGEAVTKKSPRGESAPRKRGVFTVRVRGTGCYAQGKQAEGDSRGVWVDGKLVVGGDVASKDGNVNKMSLSAKKTAGLWLLVLHLRSLATLFSCCYDT